MINFEINFISNEIQYTAKVDKVPFANRIPVQYHVTNFQPAIEGVPDPFMFIHNPLEGKYDNPTFEGDVNLSNRIFNAIKDFCLRNSIPLNI